MNPRERVIAAIEFKQPDCTPYSVNFTRQMHDKMANYLGDAHFLSKIHNHLWGTDVSKPQVDLGGERFQDEWGIIWNKSGVDKDIGVVEQYLLEDEDALDTLEIPLDEMYIRNKVEAHVRAKGDRFCMVNMGFLLFERAWTLRGMEDLLCDMIVNPDFVHALMQKICDRVLKIIDIVLEYDGVDAIYVGDDYGQQKGLIMGPKCWRTFIKPYLGKIYARIRQKGRYVFQHSCGDLRDILDDMIEMGLNAYVTYQPEIYTFEYARRLHGRLAIWGGISTQVHLPVKTPDEIYELTRQWMHYFPDGGLIAAPTHAIPGDVSPENVMAMLRAMQEQEKSDS